MNLCIIRLLFFPGQSRVTNLVDIPDEYTIEDRGTVFKINIYFTRVAI